MDFDSFVQSAWRCLRGTPWVNLVCLALALVCTPRLIRAQSIKVEPDKIQPGGRATLSWDVGRARAFVVGYGEVAGRGSVIVNPDTTTDYILTAQYPGTKIKYEYRTQQLVVIGSRGDDDDPSPVDSFVGTPTTGTCQGTAYVDFQKRAWEWLQQTGYLVRGDFAPGRTYVTLYTNFKLRPDLIASEEKLRARRLALAIDVYQPTEDKGLLFSVHTRLEKQYIGETKWRWEQESELATREAAKSVQELGGKL
jgi:hypothetical protein